MADVISFKGIPDNKANDYTDEEICKVVLEDLNKNINELKDLYIFYKTKDNLINIIHTDVGFEDRSVMLQLLQHNLNTDLNLQHEDFEDIEPDQ